MLSSKMIDISAHFMPVKEKDKEEKQRENCIVDKSRK